MKKIIISFILLCCLVSCCQDEIVTSYEISEDTKDIIPFNQDRTLIYVSQQDITFTASAKQKKLEINTERLGAESCDLIANEILTSSVFISTFEFGFKFILEKDWFDRLNFHVERYWKDGGSQIFKTDCDQSSFYNADSFTDIVINGYSFSNVLIVDNCQADSGIDRIIFSPENGIEYVDFNDGRFLKLVDN